MKKISRITAFLLLSLLTFFLVSCNNSSNDVTLELKKEEYSSFVKINNNNKTVKYDVLNTNNIYIHLIFNAVGANNMVLRDSKDITIDESIIKNVLDSRDTFYYIVLKYEDSKEKKYKLTLNYQYAVDIVNYNESLKREEVRGTVFKSSDNALLVEDIKKIVNIDTTYYTDLSFSKVVDLNNVKTSRIYMKLASKYVEILLDKEVGMSNINTGFYIIGEKITIKPVVREGYKITGYRIDFVIITNNEILYNYVIPNRDVRIEVMTERALYKVKLVYDKNAVSIPLFNDQYHFNDYFQITFTPNLNYQFIGFYINNQLISTNSNHQFKMPSRDLEIELRFVLAYDFYLSTFEPEKGEITANINFGLVEVGTLIEIKAIPRGGYTFSGWYDGEDNLISTDSNYSFSMPSKNVIIMAKWS